ncbi:hypothetical protein BABINDRAFT_166842 [Babjeviella inositovora NRRL Y-12698]|uniref:Uncharacterized protein n=1 Tax=Babjeviella inositovora NRRL Y-12698 TaxID=984486 RepID=A0A1E3QPZ5_9ASCO|nr:uncharacterized protein BABINDRAFT_166842 [Babjeviella inositovora NRRL Y-12698]ODQ79730.1 hypothetical protein BABINDRAFT_166842 [Babjeviella inositovora NRRL Y-12698]
MGKKSKAKLLPVAIEDQSKFLVDDYDYMQLQNTGNEFDLDLEYLLGNSHSMTLTNAISGESFYTREVDALVRIVDVKLTDLRALHKEVERGERDAKQSTIKSKKEINLFEGQQKVLLNDLLDLDFSSDEEAKATRINKAPKEDVRETTKEKKARENTLVAEGNKKKKSKENTPVAERKKKETKSRENTPVSEKEKGTKAKESTPEVKKKEKAKNKLRKDTSEVKRSKKYSPEVTMPEKLEPISGPEPTPGLELAPSSDAENETNRQATKAPRLKKQSKIDMSLLAGAEASSEEPAPKNKQSNTKKEDIEFAEFEALTKSEASKKKKKPKAKTEEAIDFAEFEASTKSPVSKKSKKSKQVQGNVEKVDVEVLEAIPAKPKKAKRPKQFLSREDENEAIPPIPQTKTKKKTKKETVEEDYELLNDPELQHIISQFGSTDLEAPMKGVEASPKKNTPRAKDHTRRSVPALNEESLELVESKQATPAKKARKKKSKKRSKGTSEESKESSIEAEPSKEGDKETPLE